MYENHPSFESPKKINQTIWRYMDFTKYVDLLNTSSLFFTRADYFSDIFEGSLPKLTVEKRTLTDAKLIDAGILMPIYTPEFMAKITEDRKKRKSYQLLAYE